MEKRLLLLPVFVVFFTSLLQAQIFTEDFVEGADKWEVIDANEDGKTWVWTTPSSGIYKCMRYSNHNQNDADDYFILKEPLALFLGEYSFKISYQCSFQESFEVVYGTSNDVTTMISIGNVSANGVFNWTDVVFDFEINEANAYYFAVHATSPKDQLNLDVTAIVINGEPIILPPDLQVRNIYMPIDGYGLSEDETAGIEIRNIGQGATASFSVVYVINGGEPHKQEFDISINPNETKTIELTGLDFSLPGAYIVDVVIECENEENTDNNSISGQVTHIESVSAPYQVTTLTAYEENLWSMGKPYSWQYSELYEEWWAADQEIPLYTNCVYLEEAAYRVSFDYQTGLEFIGRNYLQDFEVFIGESHTDINTWEKIAEYKNHYTQEQYQTYEKIVNITNPGSYRIAFVGKNGIDEQSYFAIKEVRVSQPYDHDIMLNSFSSQTLEAFTPISQINGEHIFVSEIRNRGMIEEIVTLEILFGDGVIHTETCILQSEEIKSVTSHILVETNAKKDEEISFKARVSIENDQTPDDNELTFSCMIGDYFARDTWKQESDYDFSSGIGFEEPVGMGSEFTLVNADKLVSYTVAFTSNANDFTAPIGIAVYKKGERFVIEDFIFYESEEPIVHEIVNRIEEGFATLEFAQPVELEPGTYFFVVEQLTGESIGICHDRSVAGEFYVTVQDEVGYYAQYQKTHYGNVILRANFWGKENTVNIDQPANKSLYCIYSKEGKVFITSEEIVNSVTIINTYGNILYYSIDNLSTYDLEISQAGWSKGIYIAQIQTAKGTQHIKFMIK